MSAIVDASVVSSAYTNATWLRKISAAASTTSRRSRRSTRNERSATRTSTTKITAAMP
jgi:hypothetical protein